MTGQDTCCTAIITRRQNVVLVQGTRSRAFHNPTHSPPRVCGYGPSSALHLHAVVLGSQSRLNWSSATCRTSPSFVSLVWPVTTICTK